MDFLHTKAVSRLFKAIRTLNSEEEYYKFFEDACTINEIFEIAQRFDVACMLTDGRTYTDVSNETGASTATISRVNKCLQYGQDGYNIAIRRLREQEKGE